LAIVVAITTNTVDLTPFGFTPTESSVYIVLLDLGPSTGYGVARAARLARANAYSALEGLSRRGAAQRMSGPPVRFRATDPQTLLIQLAAEQGERLERLSRSLHGMRHPVEPVTRPLDGTRAVTTVIQHLVARAERQIHGVLTGELWPVTLPAWRRAASRADIQIRIAGEEIETEGLASREAAPPDHPTLLLIDDLYVLVATREADTHLGLWSAHRLVVLLGKAALGGAR
jgi:sugar-specific transcriptional regulator TrmB